MKAPAPPTADALSLERIVVTAIELADRDGLSKLSMRRIAGSLGVEAMSLYHHLSNKEALLDAMVDAVFARFATPDPAGDWRSEMRRRCCSARAVLLEHRWAVALLDSRRTPGMANLLHHEAMLACGYAAGFDTPTLGLAAATLDAYVYGFVIQEIALPFDAPDEADEVANDVLAELPADRFPSFIRFATERVIGQHYRFGDEFEPGLDLLLDALVARR